MQTKDQPSYSKVLSDAKTVEAHIKPECLVSLSFLGVLKVSGQDGIKFLQGQLTCDLNQITPQQGSLGAHCNPQGRMISLFYLLKNKNDEYYLLMPKTLLGIAELALKKYAIFYKVTLESLSDHLNIFICAQRGEKCVNLNHDEILACHRINSQETIVITNKPSSFPYQQDQNSRAETAFKICQIKKKIPMIYPTTSGLYLPHDLNLPGLGAVSFSKGCFTGQEVIARMEYKGTMKKQLSYATLPLPINVIPGTEVFALYEGSMIPVGRIVDSEPDSVNHDTHSLILLDQKKFADHALFLTTHPQHYFVIPS